LGKPVIYVGEKPGMGQYMKLVNNLLSAAALAVTCEAMVLGVKAGLDSATMIEVLNAGSGRNSATQDKVPNDILTRKFKHGFSTGLIYKDIRLCLEEAERLGVPMWVGASVRQLWFQSLLASGPAADCTRIFELLESWGRSAENAPPL
jgi:3-hydroxyisobutyrate dehydrogenase-like beta-hydroxyacid dehydrogenase